MTQSLVPGLRAFSGNVQRLVELVKVVRIPRPARMPLNRWILISNKLGKLEDLTVLCL